MNGTPSRGPRGFAALRLASRLARRETVRRPWRTLLVALLVAVPVAGMVVAAVWVRTENQTPLEQWQANNGLADMYATPASPGGAPVEPGGPSLHELLPAGSRTVSYRAEHNRVLRTVEGDRASAEVTDLPMAEPLTAPIMQVTSGRAPEDAGEVFLTRELARDLDVEVGDTLRLERPEGLSWQVVGVGERRAWWDSSTVVIGSDTTFPWRDEATGYSTRRVLVDLPETVTAAQLGELSRLPEGVSFAPGVVPLGVPGGPFYEDPFSDDGQKVAWSWVIGAVVLTVVGIVITAAFAAGARRQLTMLGQLAANGASPRTLHRVLFLQGTWTGMLGAALGLALAAAALVAAAPHVDNLLNRDADPYSVRVGDLLPILALGITAATLAALVPARTTARIPVLAALAGRRPLRPVPAWLTVTGAAAGAAGLGLLGLAALGANGGGGGSVWALTAVIGGVAVLLGACAVAPGYVSILEPLASRLRGSSRLAARSLARQRTRTGAVVSAVCATSALAIGASALLLSADAKDAGEPEWMRADEVHVEAQAIEGQLDDEGGRSQRPAQVPSEYVDELHAAIPSSEVHHVGRVGVPNAGDAARWQVLEFVPDAPPSDGESEHLHLMSGPFPQYAAIADDELAELYELPAGARRALEEAGIVAIGSLPVPGTATVSLVAEHYDEPTRTTVPQLRPLVPPFEVPVVPADDLALGSLPRILVTPERAETLGLEPEPDVVVLRSDRALTEAERTAVQDISDEYRDRALDSRGPRDEIVSIHSTVLHPTATLSPRLLEGLLAAAALVLSLFVVAVSLALAAAETRDERDVLAVVGAPPRTMRRSSGSKALLLTLLGASLAVPVGFLPVSVFTAASDNDLPLVFPWRMVVLLVAAVPLVAAVVTTVFSGAALRLRPVHVSTMAFD